MYCQWIENVDSTQYTVILDACPETFVNPDNLAIRYTMENNCSELVAYKNDKVLWRADLKILFDNIDAKATQITYWNDKTKGGHSRSPVISISNNYQCISVDINALNGKAIH